MVKFQIIAKRDYYMTMKKIGKYFVIILLIGCLFLLNIFVFTSCDTDKNKYVEENKKYLIDTRNSRIKGIPLSFFTDTSSYIELRTDGTATIYVKSNEGIGGTLEYFIDKEEYIKNMDISAYEGMIADYLPGFKLEDIENGLHLLKNSTGVCIEGINFEDPTIEAFINDLSEKGKLTSNIESIDYIGIKYEANYNIENIRSESGENYTVAYMGEHNENGQPYIILTMSTDEESGKEKISFRILPVDATVVAYS